HHRLRTHRSTSTSPSVKTLVENRSGISPVYRKAATALGHLAPCHCPLTATDCTQPCNCVTSCWLAPVSALAPPCASGVGAASCTRKFFWAITCPLRLSINVAVSSMMPTLCLGRVKTWLKFFRRKYRLASTCAG